LLHFLVFDSFLLFTCLSTHLVIFFPILSWLHLSSSVCRIPLSIFCSAIL
jgi:hypothetical protein